MPILRKLLRLVLILVAAVVAAIGIAILASWFLDRPLVHPAIGVAAFLVGHIIIRYFELERKRERREEVGDEQDITEPRLIELLSNLLDWYYRVLGRLVWGWKSILTWIWVTGLFILVGSVFAFLIPDTKAFGWVLILVGIVIFASYLQVLTLHVLTGVLISVVIKR